MRIIIEPNFSKVNEQLEFFNQHNYDSLSFNLSTGTFHKKLNCSSKRCKLLCQKSVYCIHLYIITFSCYRKEALRGHRSDSRLGQLVRSLALVQALLGTFPPYSGTRSLLELPYSYFQMMLFVRKQTIYVAGNCLHIAF